MGWKEGWLYTGNELVKIFPWSEWLWSDSRQQLVLNLADAVKYWNEYPSLCVKRQAGERKVLLVNTHEIVRFHLQRKNVN